MKEMTIDEYINNPAGVGSSAIPNRELIRRDYTERYEKLVRAKGDLFMGNMYKDGQDYFIHVVIPTESEDGQNTYDVVVKFLDAEKLDKGSIRQCNIQLFSNSQSFIYTYAYVYDKEKFLVDELRNKFNPETYQPPATRNPYESISYEKTTFMSLLYILNHPELMSVQLFKHAKNKPQLLESVRHMDKIKIEQGKEKARLTDVVNSAKVSEGKRSKLKESSSTQKTTAKRGINRILPNRGSKTKPKKKITGTTKSKKITPTMGTKK